MPPSPPAERRVRLLYALFAWSGANGLCFEILWARQLQVVLGATHRAVTVVVSLFMLGLALGGILGARLALRTQRPALAYGATELGIGFSSVAVTALVPALERVASMGVRTFVAACLLTVPSALMGLTYPFVVQAADPSARGGGAGLYAANTAGAMLGCLLAGFFGIGVLGISASALVAAVGNLLCGFSVLILFRHDRSGASTSPPADPSALAIRDETAPPQMAILLAAACAGASALAAEILWTRSLLPYVNSSSYAFSAILTTYLAGLALGAAALACAHLASARLVLRFALLQLMVMVLLAATPRLLEGAEALVPGYVGIRQIASLGQIAGVMAGVFAKTALVVLLPTFLMGASLPLCIALLVRRGAAGGKAAGMASAVNTLGGIAGALLAGLVLLPGLGSRRALLAIGLGNLAAALLLLRSGRARAGLAVVAVLLAWAAQPSGSLPFVGRLAAGAHVLLVDEGPQDTTTVVEQGPAHARERLILSNGISYAGDDPASQRYMGLLGQLPVLLSRDAARALVICVGTGTTAANVAVFKDVRELDLVDISPAVTKTLPFFTHVNHGVWTDARVTLHQADGRQFMTRTPHGYGAITLEPPPPRAAGAASLYTVGLYQRARASLDPGGVIAQWLPLHGMTEVEILMLARTFLAVFPGGALFLLNPNEAALLGAARPLEIDLDRMRQRLGDAAVRAALARIGFAAETIDGMAAQLLALAPATGEDLRRLVGEGPVVTDDRPLIEQFGAVLARERGRFDPNGRRGLLRRLAAVEASAFSSQGTPLVEWPAAQAVMRAQIRAWLADAEQP